MSISSMVMSPLTVMAAVVDGVKLVNFDRNAPAEDVDRWAGYY